MALVQYKALLLYALCVLVAASAVLLNITKRQTQTDCGKDQRLQVHSTTLPPYSWIGRLTSNLGSCTTFMVNVPRVSKQVVLTARHCLKQGFTSATSITLTFPGQRSLPINSNQVFTPPSSKGQYAVILVQTLTHSSDGFGYNAVAHDETAGRTATITGYPGDKPSGTMWASGAAVSRIDNSKLYYRIDVDTTGGQSGSPVYTWWNGYWTVVGIHTNGGCGPNTTNSGQRLTLPLLNDILTWASYPWLSTPIESVHFPNRFLRMDGSRNIVNVQYTADGWEHFHIMPVLVPNSSSLVAFEENTTAYAIESAAFRGRYLRMDGQGVTRATSSGGGTVDTQTNVYAWEMYQLVPQPTYGTKVYAIGSRHFRNVYLRMDGTNVTKFLNPGGGVVNCQYGIDAWVRFKIG